ncbi:MAG: hypothetical protein Q7S37_00555 [bacterium]|nr:hypothetical protein [bacterium]
MSRKPNIKIGVSGSAINNCAPGAYKKATEIGRAIARNGAVCVTGDTTGVPLYAARGSHRAGGITVGVSPAHSQEDHERHYHLPLNDMDLVIYTGFAYSGRNLLFIRACDAVIFICGRIGTLNEFTIAFEDKKPIGILTKTGGIIEEIEQILEVSHRGRRKIVFDENPVKLVERLIDLVSEEHRHHYHSRQGE